MKMGKAKNKKGGQVYTDPTIYDIASEADVCNKDRVKRLKSLTCGQPETGRKVGKPTGENSLADRMGWDWVWYIVLSTRSVLIMSQISMK